MATFAENAQYRQHALDCGLDMTSKTCVGVDMEAVGCVLAVGHLHPEDLSEIFSIEEIITPEIVQTAKSIGLDYFIVWSA
jgi:hypothetical protein